MLGLLASNYSNRGGPAAKADGWSQILIDTVHAIVVRPQAEIYAEGEANIPIDGVT
jgi:hypothetical protein